jgi:hypothetical protein
MAIMVDRAGVENGLQEQGKKLLVNLCIAQQVVEFFGWQCAGGRASTETMAKLKS